MAWDETTRAAVQVALDAFETALDGFLDDMITDHGSTDGGQYVILTIDNPSAVAEADRYPGPVRITLPSVVKNGKTDQQRAGIVTTMRKNFQGLFNFGTISAGDVVAGVDTPLS